MGVATEALIPPAETTTQGYEYIHADGSVHRTETVEAARLICPVLGKMATEQANLLLEVAAIGQQKINNEPKGLEPNKSEKIILKEKTLSDKTADDARLETYSKIIPEAQTIDVGTAPENKAATTSMNVGAAITHKQTEASAASTETRPSVYELIVTPEVSTQNKVSDIIAQSEAHLEVEAHINTAEDTTSVDMEPLYYQDQDVKQLLPTAQDNIEQIGALPTEFKLSEIEEAAPLEAELLEMSALNNEQLATEYSEQETSADEPGKELVEVYDDFTNMLEISIALTEEIPMDSAENQAKTISSAIELNSTQELQMASEAATIATVVAEELQKQTKQEKEATAHLLGNITDTLQTITTLEVVNATPEIAKVERAELEVQIIVLFEQLGIEYESKDIKHFAAVLLNSKLKLMQLEEELPTKALNLESNGTREAKYSLPQMINNTTDDIERDIRRLMGVFALFHAYRQSIA